MNLLFVAAFLSLIAAPEVVVLVLSEEIQGSLVFAFLSMLMVSLGGTAGSTAIYFFARWIGYSRFDMFIHRYGKRLLLRERDLESVIKSYDRYGDKIVFFGRWVPTFRSLVSIPAGLNRMPAKRFVYLTFGGTLVWNFLLFSMVYSLWAYLDHVQTGLKGYAKMTMIAFVLAVLYFIVHRIGHFMSPRRKN
jgi:membrane protein DedA with SNARE-associated domain